jgi:hypothetical protein
MQASMARDLLKTSAQPPDAALEPYVAAAGGVEFPVSAHIVTAAKA